MTGLRIGHGYDVHRLTQGRRLILGGVEIPWERGLLGHSDADVLLHAVMDALLGAAALPDIGRQFPDSDPQYAGADSRELLRTVAALLRRDGWRVVNVDATLIAQAPKLSPYIQEVRGRIAGDLEIPAEQINVKATTEEHLGFTGAGGGSPPTPCVCWSGTTEQRFRGEAYRLGTSPRSLSYDTLRGGVFS